VNGDDTMRKLLPIPDTATTALDWMKAHKTDAALHIAESDITIAFPDYIRRAIGFIE